MQQPVTPAHDLTAQEREERRLEQIQRNQALIELLNGWAEGEPDEQEEQRETWELLKRALDEDRSSYRKIFP